MYSDDVEDKRTIGNHKLVPTPEHKTVTPNDTDQTILASVGAYLSRVTVQAIPNDKYAHISYDGSKIKVY